MYHMTPEQERNYVEGAFHGAAGVSEYLQAKVLPRLEGVFGTLTPRDTHLHGYFLRAFALMQSVGKLNEPRDFQSLVGCNRALLEVLVDTILVAFDEEGLSDVLIPAWEESAKLKHCTLAVDYYAKKGQPVPEALRVRQDFVNNERTRIEAARERLWPGRRRPKSHPERWTGRGSLPDDIREADSLYTVRFSHATSQRLEEFYETEFRMMCWNVHGSGFTAIRHVPPRTIASICAFAWLWSADLALETAKIVQRHFRYGDALDLPEEFANIDTNRTRILYDLVVGQGEDDSAGVSES